MGSYIVRIYQRTPHRHYDMTGILEVVESGEKLLFHNDHELWDIMAKAEAGLRKKKVVKPAQPKAEMPDIDQSGE